MYKVRIHVGVETRISQPMSREDADRLATLFERAFPGSFAAVTHLSTPDTAPSSLSITPDKCALCGKPSRALAKTEAGGPSLCGQCLNEQEAI